MANQRRSYTKQDFDVDKPNTIWVGDITYIGTDEGFMYLASVVDLFNRKVVGWAMDNVMPTKLTISALTMAIGRRNHPEGLIFHFEKEYNICRISNNSSAKPFMPRKPFDLYKIKTTLEGLLSNVVLISLTT